MCSVEQGLVVFSESTKRLLKPDLKLVVDPFLLKGSNFDRVFK